MTTCSILCQQIIENVPEQFLYADEAANEDKEDDDEIEFVSNPVQ